MNIMKIINDSNMKTTALIFFSIKLLKFEMLREKKLDLFEVFSIGIIFLIARLMYGGKTFTKEDLGALQTFLVIVFPST